MSVDVSVLIITHNEEINLPYALRSVDGWAKQIVIVDAHSEDRTLEIARQFGCVVISNAFESFPAQRQFAIRNCPRETEWALFLDADEWLTDGLKEEIRETLLGNPRENGFFLRRNLIFMGLRLRWGYGSTWLLRLGRIEKMSCESRPVNEHLRIDGPVRKLTQPFYDENRKGLSAWMEKHQRYAALEAGVDAGPDSSAGLPARLRGSPPQRKRWFRQKIWNRMPLLFRPWLLFGWRYVLRLGFLDGRAGLVYHFLHDLWYRMLIDILILEHRKRGAPRSEADRAEKGNERLK
jgi:glycosyltransferase involved in cell wall biosynthesis